MSMEPKDEAIREINKAYSNAGNWFKVLARHCEHRNGWECHKYPGVLLTCALKKCPILTRIDVLGNE